MNECFFGIKCNGVSLSVAQISIKEDQTKFDYICNVSLKYDSNGNGIYDVSIMNKDYYSGLPIGKWKIKKAWIRYDWGDSKSIFIMEDEQGDETCELIAANQKGSCSGFHLPSLTIPIFTKAQEIVRDYPNARICSSITKLDESKRLLNLSYTISRYKEIRNKSDEEYIDYIKYCSEKINKYLEVFKTAADLLKRADDQRSKSLLKDITSDCRHLLDYFIKECNT